MLISIIGAISRPNEKNVVVENSEIQARYYVLQEGYQYGVIDVEGNKIIEAQYDDIDIPNPEKDVFICKKIEENELEEIKILNSRQEEILKEYKNVSPIELNKDGNETEYEKQVLQYEENGKYGLINFEGKRLTEAIYDKVEALKYKEGDLLVKQENQYGVVNRKGKTVIKPKYDRIEGDGYYHTEDKYTKTGYIVCKKEKDGYKYGYMDNQGKQVLKNEYSEIYRVLEAEDKQNTYLVARKNGKVGFIKNNKKVLDYEYQNIEYDSLNGLIKVQKNTKYGVYNINGEEVIQAKYDEISFRGKYIYAQKEEKVQYFSLTGQEMKNLNYLSVNETDNENFYTCIDKNGLYGILDKNENVLVENDYHYLEYLYGDYFIAIEDEKLGVIKANNDIMLPFEYDTIDKIEDSNLVQAMKSDGTVDLFSKDLKRIFGIENPKIEKIGTVIKLYNEKQQNQYFDQEGNQIKMQQAFPQSKTYPKLQEGKWGLEDSNGKEILTCEYDYVTELNQYGLIGIKKEGKWGCVNESGKMIVEPKYEIEEDRIPIFNQGYYTLENSNTAIFYAES